MRIVKSVMIASAATAAAASSPALATPLKYTFSSASSPSSNFTFEADSNPVVTNTSSGGFNTTVNFTTGAVTTPNYLIYFYSTLTGGGMWTSPSFTPYGAQLYSGSASSPTLLTGTFNLYGKEAQTDLLGTLSVTAAPEPATWAMMILGFGVIGFAMRRNKTKVQVRHA